MSSWMMLKTVRTGMRMLVQNFEEYLNDLYPECYGGSDLACEIIDDTIREYWEILQDWCEQGYTEVCDYLDETGDELVDDCDQGDH